MSQTTTHLTIQKVVRETEDCISIYFQQPWHKMIKYKAGQFLTVLAEIDGEKIRRAYSLSSSPDADAFPSIAVKRIPEGKMSNFLFDYAAPGKGLEVLEPMGSFAYEPEKEKKRHFMLYAAGSGITPLFGIMKSVLKMEPQSIVTLIYGNRSEDTIIFRQQIKDLEAQFPNNLQVIHTLSSPPNVWYGATGRISEELVAELLEQTQPLFPVSETFHYLCGPKGMMETVEKVLKGTGHKKDSIFKESFFNDPATKELAEEETESTITERLVKVIYDDETFSFSVAPHKTILEAAQDNDIDLPYSCQSGLCTACRGKCLSGEVLMDETDGLSQKELDNGYILTCVAHPKTEDVVIEIG